MLILKSEDFFACPSETLELDSSLGLPERDFKLEGRRNEGNYSEPMASETRRWLKEYYEPHNRRLDEYLDVDFGW